MAKKQLKKSKAMQRSILRAAKFFGHPVDEFNLDFVGEVCNVNNRKIGYYFCCQMRHKLWGFDTIYVFHNGEINYPILRIPFSTFKKS